MKYAYISVESKLTEEFPLHCDDEKLLKAARKTVRNMDKLGGKMGTGHLDMELRTIMSALECGINGKRFDAVAEALVMLQQLEQAVRMDAKTTDEINKSISFKNN